MLKKAIANRKNIKVTADGVARACIGSSIGIVGWGGAIAVTWPLALVRAVIVYGWTRPRISKSEQGE